MAITQTFRDDIISGGGNRKYQLIANEDNTYSLIDATTYSQVGTTINAAIFNLFKSEINKIKNTTQKTLGTSWTLDSAKSLYYQDVSFTGMTATDIVRVIPVYTNKTIAQIEAIDEEIYKIKYFNTMAGKIRFYASEKTTASLSLIVIGV